jgi:hypothetical protein
MSGKRYWQVGDLIALKGRWEESKHPRADDGRFGDKPGQHDKKPDDKKKPEAAPDDDESPESVAEYQKREAARKKERKKRPVLTTQDLRKKLKTPEGFTLTETPETQSTFAAFTFTDGTVTISIDAPDGFKSKEPIDDAFGVSGHTSFKRPDGRTYSFDRRGIEDSFYVRGRDTPDEINASIAEQIKKARASLAENETATTMPGTGFLFSEKKREGIKETLNRGETYTIHPAGMGTAYLLTTNPRAKGASGFQSRPEWAKYFGVEELYARSQDWD